MENDEAPAARDRALIEKEAVAWFTRMNGKPTKAEQVDFASWRALSPDHERAYREVGSLWGDLGVAARELTDKVSDDLAVPLQKIAHFRKDKRRSKAGPIVTGFLALFVGATWAWLDHPHFVQNLAADFSTAKAERRAVTLADGSTVLMDADTAFDANISAAGRRVRLLRGSAYFTVQRSVVPFIVEAGNGQASVLGTQFDVVLMNDSNVAVTLSSGSLEVAFSGDENAVVLKPGESIEYNEAGLGTVRTVNLAESMAWHEGRLIFNNARLSDVLAQIERYRDGRIIVLGSELGEKRVSGNTSLENTEATIAALQASLGFRVTRLGGKVVLIGP
ncbi:FecR family protein [Shinella curvata]|uniref:FecR family protein n=1 Tax=Shinella curvata TaxID=1817964 RepID=A0ABT8XDH5_9HYPH|nr:FecR family protein [Shinella curvata]MCJ8055375.1 FecR family protein [Shinella curvata]MDO6121792.1 FecR family protein [Shinella curvata]